MLIDRSTLVKAGYDISEKSLGHAEEFLVAMFRLWERSGCAVTMEQVEKELGVGTGGAGDSYRTLKELDLVGMAPGEIGGGRFTLRAIKLNECSLFWAAA